ncbi:hypothetical protein Btru_064840 [Bulinus truncatus]|nr:hypothetical protein Btru_064840 [Bulinus truncatus]
MISLNGVLGSWKSNKSTIRQIITLLLCELNWQNQVTAVSFICHSLSDWNWARVQYIFFINSIQIMEATSDNNLTLTLFGKQDLRLVNKPVPEPQEGEVQLSIKSVGICGSDVSFWQKGRIGNFIVNGPVALGHEPSGVVSKLGPVVTGLKVGDRVAVEPLIPCGRCVYCKAGHYNVCVDLKYLALPPTHGCLCRYFCHPATFVHKLPDNVSFDEGALVQPLALGFHACQRGEVSVGHYVLVSGAGPMGMVCVLAAKVRGAARICVTDVIESRLDFIKTIGADVTVNVSNEDPKLSSQKITELFGRPVDVAIECSGEQDGVNTAIYSCRPTGKVVIVGLGQDTTELPLLVATLKQLDIRGMVRLANNYDTVIEAISSGQANVRQLITHRYSLNDALAAYDAALKREGNKIVIDCSVDGEGNEQK